MLKPLSRREGSFFEPLVTAWSLTIPVEALSLTANAPVSSPLYANLPAITFSLTANALSYALSVAIPAESLTFAANEPTLTFTTNLPVAALSLTANAPFVPVQYAIPAIPLTLAQNTFTLVYEFEIPETALSLTANPPGLAVFATHTTNYRYAPVALHRTTYESAIPFALHETTWTQSVHALHTQTYQSLVKLKVQQTHEATYASTGLSGVYQLHETAYASIGLNTVYQLHANTYQSVGMTFVAGIHEALWSSFVRIPGYTVHEVDWRSVGTSLVLSVHEASWVSVGLATVQATHETGWVSLGANSVFASHACLWRSTPTAQAVQEATYQAILGALASHRANYASTNTLVPWATHEARWRSFSLDAQTTLANAYIEPDIQLLAAQVTADEDSPYYQCEVTLRDPKDYQRFMRDQAFILHLFNDAYHFVVDTKGLNRSIDDQGNYSEVATLSGLSPLCLKASPRSQPITKTWDAPTFASSIVQELIGTVTWNLVDWQLPAYRLAVENADPFEVAQQIVNAAGGLIESQPDGSVVIRHRWPISIAELDQYSPDAILYEDSIYAAQESPTNDDLMNRIRITDNGSYQDRLEYVPNRVGENDDPWNGMLYAFPSPWRSGLTIATTRGSQIQLGAQREGTRTIADTNDDYPAETLTFEAGTSSTAYPIQSLISVDWLDEHLGGLTYSPYATTVEASGQGTYAGYSLAKVEYTTRYLAVPVACRPNTETIEAQFLLLENP